MVNNANKIWSNVLELTRDEIGGERFNLWFKNVKMPTYGGGTVNIIVPNTFVKSWFEDNFLAIIRKNLQTVTNNEVDNIRFSVDGASFNDTAAGQPPDNKDNNGKDNTSVNQQVMKKRGQTDRLLTLEDFVVGDCNRLAYASALEMIKTDEISFNALFIHGQVGVGKTHLLHAIWNSVRNNDNDTRNIAYLPAESWTNEFISSLQKGRLDTFRRKYRNLDILLIDDVHFVASKPGVQEELLHTFNILHGMSRKIVFASDAHPKYINKLKESLASRFMTGMVSRIDPPDFKTACLILDSKLKKLRREFPAAVMEYIAETFFTNVRELECALTTVLAVSNITNRQIDVALAKEALEDHVPDRSRAITIKNIEDAVIKHFSITLTELHSNKRTNTIALPRQVAMYLASAMTNLSMQQIGHHLGGKRHTTVMHGINKIKNVMKNDSEMKRCVEMLQGQL